MQIAPQSQQKKYPLNKARLALNFGFGSGCFSAITVPMSVKQLYDDLRMLGPAPTGSEAALYRREIFLAEMIGLSGTDPIEEAVVLPGSRAAISAGMMIMLIILAAFTLFYPPVAMVFGLMTGVMLFLHMDGRFSFWLALGAQKIASNSSILRPGGKPVLIIHASLTHWPVGGPFSRLLARYVAEDVAKRVLYISTMLTAVLLPLLSVLPGGDGLLAAILVLLMIIWASIALVQGDARRAVSGAELTGPIAALQLAQRLWPREDLSCELRLLITEGDQSALLGIRRYLDSHIDDLAGRPVSMISFDNVGAGYPALVESAGILHQHILAGPLFNRLSGIDLGHFSGTGALSFSRMERRSINLSDVAALAAKRIGIDTALIMGHDQTGQRAGRREWNLSSSLVGEQISVVVAAVASAVINHYAKPETTS